MIDKKQIRKLIEDEGHIHTRIVIEIIGKPKAHIEETLKGYVKAIEENDNHIVIKKEIVKAKKYEADLFSIFAEMEILFKHVKDIHYFCFSYMPASIEIVAPDRIVYDAYELTGVINEFQAKLHQLDMNLKKMNVMNENMHHNFTNLLKNHVMMILKISPKTLEELIKITGVKKENLIKFLKIMETEKRIIQKESKFYLNIK